MRVLQAMNSYALLLTSALLVGAILMFSVGHASESVPLSRDKALTAFAIGFSSSHRNSYITDMDSEPDSEYVLEMLARLGQSIIRANDMENKKCHHVLKALKYEHIIIVLGTQMNVHPYEHKLVHGQGPLDPHEGVSGPRCDIVIRFCAPNTAASTHYQVCNCVRVGQPALPRCRQSPLRSPTSHVLSNVSIETTGPVKGPKYRTQCPIPYYIPSILELLFPQEENVLTMKITTSFEPDCKNINKPWSAQTFPQFAVSGDDLSCGQHMSGCSNLLEEFKNNSSNALQSKISVWNGLLVIPVEVQFLLKS
ncbi:hypothetical protein C0J52_23388 [Blattella germanica]|nr:hypothetical protein C0J52_23388 [Blattella germanica]